MSRRCLLAATLSVFLCPVFIFAGEPPAAKAGKLVILPESFLRGYDPVTIFFPKAMVSGQGPEDHPERYVRMEPAEPGAFNWADSKTLIFVPVTPWPPLASFTVSAGGAERKLFTLLAPPISIDPSDGERDLEPVEEVTLTFSTPIPQDKLAEMVTFELRPLPGVERRVSRVLTDQDYSLKAIERSSAKDPAKYVFRFKEPVPDGFKVVARLKLSLDERSRSSFMEYAFSTREPFRVAAAGCMEGAASAESSYGESRHEYGGSSYENESADDGEEGGGQQEYQRSSREEPPGPRPGLLPLAIGGTRYGREQAVNGGAESPRLTIQFSSEPEPLTLSLVKALLHVTPSIKEMSFSQSGLYLYVTGKVDRDALYRAELLPAPIHDARGRPLQMEGTSEFYFYFPKRSSFLRWSQSHGIIERFGPQMFPLSGRGDSKVDVRIYKISPLDRNFWPFPSTPVVIDEQSRPPGPGEEPQDAETLASYVSAADLARRIKLLGSPAVSRIVDLPIRPSGSATGFGLPLKEALAEISGAGAPGTYLVGIRRLNSETNRDYVRVQVTDLCLSTVEEKRAVEFLVTSLKTGEPVEGAAVKVERQLSGQGPYDAAISGRTDSRGLFRWEHKARVEGRVTRIVVTDGDDTLVILPSDPPYAFANDHWYGPRGRWLGWVESDPVKETSVEDLLMAHIFTERPVYRPEDEVNIKGYLRLREKGRLELPPAGSWEVVITDPGEKEYRYPVEITPDGSFYLKFQERDLPSGKYEAVLHEIKTDKSYGTVDWRMEAYRIPRFEVSIQGPDQVPMDKEFTITATADYYAGGRVVGQDVAWRVTQFPYAFVPKGMPGFNFSSDERFSKPGRFQPPGAIEKKDKTDASGASVLTLNPALEMDARPRRYVCEVTVTGADDQTVSTARQVLALPPFMLGLKVDRFQPEVTAIHPEVIAIDGGGAAVKGLDATVRLLQRQWHSTLTESDFATGKAKYQTEVVDKEIFKTTVSTSEKPLPIELAIPESGIYVVEVSSRDRLGRLQIVSVDLYAGGKKPMSWKKPEANIFETSSDKPEYNPGETARILIKSPYQNARVLAVAEAPEGNIYEELNVEGGHAVYSFKIENSYNPRIPVHFLLMRGRVPGALLGGVDLGKPGTVASTSWLKVNPVDNQLSVTLAHPDKVLPGQEMTVKITLSTPDGRPVPGEVTLWLVDQAVLSLGKEKRLDPLPSFIRDVESALSIRDTRNSAIGEIATEESPGGGGTEEENNLLGRVTVRKEFKTVPYYNPRILVDSSGKAEVTFKISDDLTNFRVRAVACSGPARFGFAKSSISVRLPVIVQPALPRFARVGDSFTAGGIGRVVEGGGGKGLCEIMVEGASLSGETKRELEWNKDKPEKLFFPMKVLPPTANSSGPQASPALTVKLAVKRDSDNASDAFEVKIPLLPDREPVRKESFKKVAAGETAEAPGIDSAPREGSTRQELLVTDQEALLKMAAGLDYLYSYPYGCTEQRVSCAYPLVALKAIYDDFHMEPSAEKAQELLENAFGYLDKTLTQEGLYSYWPGGRGCVSLTAYVVSFLSEAKRSGVPFAPKLLEKPVAALKQALRSDYSGFIDGAAFMERCEALQALSLAGEFDEAYGSELARKAGYLDLYSEAEVLCAYNEGQKGGDEMLPPLRKDIWDNTVFKLREGHEVYGGLQSRINQWGGLVLSSELKTEAAVIRALYPTSKDDPKMKLMVDDLIAAGTGDGWGNTNTNAAALLALRDVLAKPSLKESVQFDVVQGGDSRKGAIGPDSPTFYYVTGNHVPLKVTRSAGDGAKPIYARFRTSYLPSAGGESVAAESDGFVVRREIIRVPAGNTPPSREWIEKEGQTFKFQSGDVVEEHAQVINPEKRHFVVVVVPFAAGMEPLNPSLATAPKEAQPSGSLTLEPSYVQYLDDEARFYYETLPQGTFDFYFRVRAVTAGSFVHPPAHASMMYRESVRGNSPGARYVIAPREEN